MDTGPVHHVVCPFTPKLLLAVAPEGWHTTVGIGTQQLQAVA